MSTPLARLAHTLRRDENGIALVMVIGVGSVLALLTVTALVVALGSARSARTDESWNGALAAAYAGVEDYQSRLAADPTYSRFGNPAADYSASSASSLTLPSGAANNTAFGLGVAGPWATVPGSEAKASYRYEVDSSGVDTTGTVSIRSTGRVGDQTRSIVARLRVNSFLDYLYFTDYEILDPAQSGADRTCAEYAYIGRPAGVNCREIAFGPTDALDGPVHSNDIIRSCEATFRGRVTTAYSVTSGTPYAPMDSNGTGCGASTFLDATSPSTVGLVVMPVTNTALKLETRTDLSTSPGCLYTGPTSIVLHANGTVTVRSPWTKATQITGSPATGGIAPAACGTLGSDVGGLASTAGSTFAVPTGNVMYVQDVPSAATDPNYWAPGAFPQLSAASGTAGATAALTCTGASGQANGNGIGFPTTGEVAPSDTAYGCTAGDAFVSGELHGALTIATSHYLYVTDDVTYADPGVDILGLVGDGAVQVWNPVNAVGNSELPAAARGDRTIQAAILSVAHTFQVQNYTMGGARGVLTVFGAIAQKFRGAVAQLSSGHGGVVLSGYAKNYTYDSRFAYLTPPKFLLPVSTTYGVTAWIEVASAFTATGAAP